MPVDVNVVLHNHSGYPRDPDAAGERRPVTRAEIDAVIDEQLTAGMDVVTDGQLDEADPVGRTLGALEGVALQAARNCAAHDASCRQAAVRARVRRRGPMFLERFVAGRHGRSGQLKAVLTGPYTLARHCTLEGGPYGSHADLARDLSGILAEETAALAAEGARWIQVEEPAILERPEEIRLLRNLLEPLWQARGDASLIVATYGRDAVPSYAQLHSLPADVVAVDFTRSPGLVELVAETGASQQLAIGAVDGRSSAVEAVEPLALQVERMLRHYVHDTVHLLPSCTLQRLPRPVARRKLEALARLRSLLGGSA